MTVKVRIVNSWEIPKIKFDRDYIKIVELGVESARNFLDYLLEYPNSTYQEENIVLDTIIQELDSTQGVVFGKEAKVSYLILKIVE